jgi:hypothetical protein
VERVAKILTVLVAEVLSKMPALDNSQIGSVGHLVGASLATAGQYLQSQMLDVFERGLSSQLGVLLFVLSSLIGLSAFVFTGKGRLWVPFLLGPPLFFFLTLYRVPSYGSLWQFGSRQYEPEYVVKGTQGLKGEPETITTQQIKPAQISFAFALFDRVVSRMTQAFVTALESTNRKSDLTFISKSDRYFSLFNLEARDWKIKYFMNLTAVNKCSDYYLLLREYYNPAIDDIRRRFVRDQLALKGKSTVVTGVEYRGFFSWLQEMGWLDEIRNRVGVPASTPIDQITMSCDQLWDASMVVFRTHATKLIDEVASTNLSPGLTANDSLKELQEKFATSTNHPDRTVDKLDDSQAFLYMVNEVSARLFLKELKKISPNLAQIEYGKNTVMGPSGSFEAYTEQSKALRAIQTADEYEEKADYLMAILALPYVQGMMLYFLTIAFPLFALCLVIPGRHGGFLLWLGLWVWVKLWDVGFAAVMLIDNILYQLLPHGPPLTDDIAKNPGVAIATLLSVDPTYSQHTYYNLVATCMAAVPILTGALVKKGGSDFISMASDNLTQFSGRVGNSMASYARNLKAESEYMKFNRNMEAAAERALGTIENDPIFRAAADGKVGDISAGAIANARGMVPIQNFTAGLRALANSSASHRQSIMQSRAQQIMARAMYAEGYALHNRQAAQGALRQKYYSHDFFSGFPGEAELGITKAYANYQIASAAPSLAAGGVRTLLDMGGMSKVAGLGAAPGLMAMINTPIPAQDIPGSTRADGSWVPMEK